VTSRATLALLIFLAHRSAEAQSNHTLSAPEALAGRWETPDGHGGAVGMNVILTTYIDGVQSSIAGHDQHVSNITIGLYHRTSPDVDELGFSFFPAATDVGANGDGYQLAIHFPGRVAISAVNLDLVWHEQSQTWSGLFERGAFRGQVSLKRPASKSSVSPFAGTWSRTHAMMNTCLHIAQQQDGSLTAWSDDLQALGRVRYANGIQPPAQMLEHYGEIAKAKVDASGQITVELRAYTAKCCSHSFTARLSPDGQLLSGNWLAGLNQNPTAVEWKKAPGISCVNGDIPEPH
jgi:hypothetical protein